MAVAVQSAPISVEESDHNEEDQGTQEIMEDPVRPSSQQKKGSVTFELGDVVVAPEPAVTTSTTLMAPVKPLNLTIFTMDQCSHKMTFSTGRHTMAGDILKELITYFSMPEEMSNVFSIWMVSKHLQLQLKSYHIPVKLFKRWKDFLTQYTNVLKDDCEKDKPILYFRRNAFLPIKEEKRLIAKKNSKLALTLLYKEAVCSVVNGLYPLSDEEITELAGIQCAVENSQFDQKEHTPDSFKDEVSSYFPAFMIANNSSGGGMKTKLLLGGKVGGAGKGQSSLEEVLCKTYEATWNKVSDGVKKRKEKSVDVEKSAVAVSLGKEEEEKLWEDVDLQLKLLYLQRCWIKPYYGCVMFKGQVERKASNIKQLLVYSDRAVVVAINPESVHIFKEATDTSPREIMLYLTYDLLLWDFQPATEEGENFYSSLWLQFDSTLGRKKVAKRLQIFSRQAPMMDAMITRCVDELNELDEQMKKIRMQQDPSARDAPVYSIDTQTATASSQPSKNYLEDKLICDTYDNSTGDLVSKFSGLPFKRKKSSVDMTQIPPPGIERRESSDL